MRRTPCVLTKVGESSFVLNMSVHFEMLIISTPPLPGAGAGQALEDGYILGRALRDYFDAAEHGVTTCSIHDALSLYNSIRYPRSEKVQTTSRQAGDLYELKAPELAKLSYDDALPVVERLLKNRMQWIWAEDIDTVYEAARKNFSRL